MDIRISQNNFSQTTFKSTRRHVVNEVGQAINCHYTNLDRGGQNIANFVRMLPKRYKGLQKLIINIFGCSDASRVYTFKLYIRKLLGENALNNIEINASDISSDIIESNCRGEILLHNKDLEFLNSMDANHFFTRNYSNPVEQMRGIDFYPYIVSEELRKNVNFDVKDVREEVKHQNFSNQVFAFCNAWTYSDLEQQKQITENLYDNSNELTLCGIGQSDLFKSNASDYFQSNGFRGIGQDIFTIDETDYPSDTIGMPKEPAKYPKFLLFERKK